MSKINAIRIVNLSYNKGTNRIDDEIYYMGSKNTFMSLRNGGGKSVLVQMISAPFVNASYRDTPKRPFKSYFTSPTPTYILVEWDKGPNAGFVLTGLMIRKNQLPETEIQRGKELEIYSFTHEYKTSNEYDLENFPVIEQLQEGKKVKSFDVAKKMFEKHVKENPYFRMYNMTDDSARRRYFNKLKENKIYKAEWESILKDINSDESGLSNLFENAGNEYGLVSKWFLAKIKDKLNREEDRIKKFCHIVDEYITQYNNNKANIRKQENVYKFKEETAQLLEYAEKIHEAMLANKAIKNKIACIVLTLKNMHEEATIALQQYSKELEDEKATLNEIHYEELSISIHTITKEIADIEEELEDSRNELEEVEDQERETTRDLHILECSKLFEELQENAKRVLQRENELEISRKRLEDLEPERINLGYSIKCYYENEEDRLQGLVESTIEAIEAKKKEIVRLEEQEKAVNSLNTDLAQKEGVLETEIKVFDTVQKAFNERFGETLVQNVLGEYPEGVLEDKRDVIDDAIAQIEKEIKETRYAQDQNMEIFRTVDRELTAAADVLNEYHALEKEKRQEKVKFEGYIEERLHLMQYIEIEEKDVFDTEKLVLGAKKEIERLKLVEKNTQIKQNEYELELTKLQTGKVFELPEEVSAKLNKKDIQYLYGMEWLKNNSKTTAENKKIIENNPFIPFSIILSAGELERLKKESLDIYTSLPVPIIQREKLEIDNSAYVNGVVELDNVNFYVAFNTNLLDVQELERLKEELVVKIATLEEKLREVGKTILTIQTLLNRVEQQNFSKKLYDDCKKAIDAVTKDIADTKERIRDLQDEKEEVDHKRFEYQGQMHKLSGKLQLEEDKLKAFERLVDSYEEYLEQRSELGELRKKQKETSELLVEVGKKTQKLRALLENDIDAKNKYDNSLENVKVKVDSYSIFKTGERIEQDIVDLEPRFEAINTQSAIEEEMLEKLVQEATKDYSRKENDLTEKQREYGLEEPDFSGIRYDKHKEIALKQQRQTYEEEIADILSKIQDSSNEKIRKESDRAHAYKALVENEKIPNEPKALEQITNLNFEERKVSSNKKISQLIKLKEATVKKLSAIKNSLAALENFVDYEVENYERIEINLDEVEEQRLALIKEINLSDKIIEDKIKELEKSLDAVIKIKEFEDPFFKIPLENLVDIVNKPEVFIQQLNIVLSSYEQRLEQLRVDLQFVTDEKDKILQVLLQYIRDVHSEMDKIDNNSSIKIRERSVKMLSVQIPKWEDNEEYYAIRLRDLIDSLTDEALQCLEENKPIKDVISQTINISNLYDQVVGIGNVKITLYKIEAEREQVVTWSEVAANSGGEGFLSAFVILSSLLNLMRRDDMDIFAEKNEGKVLVMDNPFAKANAVHLLKPLIEIANKSNTQLICFSGLGGDSILNRFDNMYILNPTRAKFKKNVEIMQSEHVKGREYERIVSTRIEVEDGEQVELF